LIKITIFCYIFDPWSRLINFLSDNILKFDIENDKTKTNSQRSQTKTKRNNGYVAIPQKYALGYGQTINPMLTFSSQRPHVLIRFHFRSSKMVNDYPSYDPILKCWEDCLNIELDQITQAQKQKTLVLVRRNAIIEINQSLQKIFAEKGYAQCDRSWGINIAFCADKSHQSWADFHKCDIHHGSLFVEKIQIYELVQYCPGKRSFQSIQRFEKQDELWV